MLIAQKLKIIQSLSGLTQVKLASRLGVSFATINSWLNGKSLPHRNALNRINELYYEYTGQKEFPDDVGKAKKQIITAKSKKHKNIIQLIRKRRDIYDQFVLSLTYNTNRIEGSTLNEAQTAAILFDNITFSNKKLFEHIEVKNHQTALAYLFKYVSENNKLNEAFILKIHSLLLNGIQEDAGLYRKHGVRIVGANVPTANYLKIPQLMKEIVKDINRQKKDIISHVSEIHSRFEQVHPFSDGNGRIGRLIIHAMLLKKNIPPTIITVKKKKIYLSVLNKAQVKNELVPLEDFICDSILESYSMIEKSM